MNIEGLLLLAIINSRNILWHDRSILKWQTKWLSHDQAASSYKILGVILVECGGLSCQICPLCSVESPSCPTTANKTCTVYEYQSILEDTQNKHVTHMHAYTYNLWPLWFKQLTHLKPWPFSCLECLFLHWQSRNLVLSKHLEASCSWDTTPLASDKSGPEGA